MCMARRPVGPALYWVVPSVADADQLPVIMASCPALVPNWALSSSTRKSQVAPFGKVAPVRVITFAFLLVLMVGLPPQLLPPKVGIL